MIPEVMSVSHPALIRRMLAPANVRSRHASEIVLSLGAVSAVLGAVSATRCCLSCTGCCLSSQAETSLPCHGFLAPAPALS